MTGLTSGGISCFAVQGGLLTSALASNEELEVSRGLKAKALSAFLISKIVAYTLLGFLLGFLGATLQISPRVQGWMQIIIGLYMIATALRLLDIHPIFRYFVIQPPRSVLRLLRNQARAQTVFTPAFLGALTVLIPCGVTQAMMVLALGTGNPFFGAGIMFAFTLGTSPLFFALGIATTELIKKRPFAIAAALFILAIGLISINTGQILKGSAHTFQNYYFAAFGTPAESKTADIKKGIQEVTINVTSGGYSSDTNTLKIGVPVKLKLVADQVDGCARAFTIPELNYFKVLPENGEEFIEFTPKKLGALTYTCSMGMFTGQFTVVN
jgi:sulfite exporter TauE/SafE